MQITGHLRREHEGWSTSGEPTPGDSRERRRQRSADACGLSLQTHTHTEDQARNGGCPICGASLTTLQSSGVDIAPINEALASLQQSLDTAQAAYVSGVYASELIARGSPLRHVHQMAKKFLLDPNEEKGGPGRFWDRVSEFINPEAGVTKPADTCELLRLLHYKKPGRFALRFPVCGLQGTDLVLEAPETPVDPPGQESASPGSEEPSIDDGPARKVATQKMDKVPGSSAARELAIEDFRLTTELWLAYVRLAIGDARNYRRRVLAEGDVRVKQSGRLYLHPAFEHRRLWGQEDAGTGVLSLISARLMYREEDRVRLDAATQWAGLAFMIWPEGPIRAAGLIWMALEALYGGRSQVLGTGTALYLNRLPVELASEVCRYFERLRHMHTVPFPAWLNGVCRPDGEQSRREWLQGVHGKVPRDDDGIALRIEEILTLYAAGTRAHLVPLYRRDLQLLYAVRNGIAHKGHFQVAPALAVYLFNLGIEVLKAGISDVIAAAKVAHETSKGTLTMDAAWANRL